MLFSSQIYPIPLQRNYYPFYQKPNYQLLVNQNACLNNNLLNQPMSFPSQIGQISFANYTPINYFNTYYLSDKNCINYNNQSNINKIQDLNYQINYQNYHFDDLIKNPINLDSKNNNINFYKSIPLTMEGRNDKNYLNNSASLNDNKDNFIPTCRKMKNSEDKNNIKNVSNLIVKKRQRYLSSDKSFKLKNNFIKNNEPIFIYDLKNKRHLSLSIDKNNRQIKEESILPIEYEKKYNHKRIKRVSSQPIYNISKNKQARSNSYEINSNKIIKAAKNEIFIKKDNNIELIKLHENSNSDNRNKISNIIKENRQINNINNNTISNDYNDNFEHSIADENPTENFSPSDFKILKEIGEGEYGKLYSVIWLKNNKRYAMKIIKLNNYQEFNLCESKIKLIQNFYNNTKYDGIVRIYADLSYKAVDSYIYYIIMELAEIDWDKEIYSRYRYHDYYSEKELINILNQLITTCALLQKNHISHRDIKAQNILVKNKKYKLSDFGEAKILEKSGVIIQQIRGTEMYMSPILFFALHDINGPKEKITHNTYKSDVYSLGMCALYAATLTLESCCAIRQLKDMNIVESIVREYLEDKFSLDFISFILEMLEVDEYLRPDFIQLEIQIKKMAN